MDEDDVVLLLQIGRHHKVMLHAKMDLLIFNMHVENMAMTNVLQKLVEPRPNSRFGVIVEQAGQSIVVVYIKHLHDFLLHVLTHHRVLFDGAFSLNNMNDA